MPRYRATDPGEELGAGIESLGASIAGLITARKQKAALEDQQAQDTKLWDAIVQPDASGKMVGERLSEAPNKPLAVLKWMQDIGVQPSSERLAQIMTMVTPPAGDGPHVQTMPAEEYFTRIGLSTPGALKGAIVKYDAKSGNADFLYKPDKEDAPGPKWQHVGGGMFVNMNDPSQPPIDQQEVYKRELALRSAGASSNSVNVNIPDGSAKLTTEMRNSYSTKRSTLSTLKDSLKTVKNYKPNLAERAAASAGFVGPQGAAADSARSAMLFSIAKLAEQGALQEPDKKVAEAMIGQIFDPRIGPETRDAAMNQFEKWVAAQERSNEELIKSVPPDSAPIVQPSGPASAKESVAPSAPARIKIDAQGNILK